jgi:hypothetical protein
VPAVVHPGDQLSCGACCRKSGVRALDRHDIFHAIENRFVYSTNYRCKLLQVDQN